LICVPSRPRHGRSHPVRAVWMCGRAHSATRSGSAHEPARNGSGCHSRWLARLGGTAEGFDWPTAAWRNGRGF
jgi:hypothetical protein